MRTLGDFYKLYALIMFRLMSRAMAHGNVMMVYEFNATAYLLFTHIGRAYVPIPLTPKLDEIPAEAPIPECTEKVHFMELVRRHDPHLKVEV